MGVVRKEEEEEVGFEAFFLSSISIISDGKEEVAVVGLLTRRSTATRSYITLTLPYFALHYMPPGYREGLERLPSPPSSSPSLTPYLA